MIPIETPSLSWLPLVVAFVACLGGCAPDGADADAGQAASVDVAAEPADATEPGEGEADSSADASAPTTPTESLHGFLAENAAREGVVTTASGLQYEVLTSGEGATPGPTDVVTTHYHGTFEDGRVFDSSVQRGVPASFPVNGVIKGWTEALQMMKVGDKWRIVCPPELAYGASGRAGIPPNATLVFEVELLDVKPNG